MDLWSPRRTMLVRRQEARVCQGNQRNTSSEDTITTARGPQCRADIHRVATSQATKIRRREQQYPSVLGLGAPLAEIKLTALLAGGHPKHKRPLSGASLCGRHCLCPSDESDAALRERKGRSPCGSTNAREKHWDSKTQPIDYDWCCADRLNSPSDSRRPAALMIEAEGGRAHGLPTAQA
jgi:hypothetical protein